MKKLIYIIGAFILTAFPAFADVLPEPVASLLPTPQNIEILEDRVFNIPDEIDVYAENGFESSAGNLEKELPQRFNASVRIVGKDKFSEAEVIIEMSDDTSDSDKAKDESYSLHSAGGTVKIAARTPAGAFYGVQTLIQLIREKDGKLTLPSVHIKDRPALPIRGVTDDISRGQVPTMDDFKRTIRLLAHFKMNTYFIYIEDVFHFDKYPSIGEKRGALTRDEIAELQEYAKGYHVELIPIFQTLGHMENILLQPGFMDLAEFPGAFCLAPLQKETYDFIGDLLSEVVPAFSSEYFHIGADETWDVGLGRSRVFMPKMDVAEIHLRHYERVLEMLKPYDRKIMLYSDMLLRHTSILETLPRDLIVFDWHYQAAEEFASLDVFRESGHSVVVSPSVANWKRFFPDLLAAEANILNFIRQGKRYANVIGAATSSWGDNGQENFRELNWYGYALTAETAWAREARPAAEIRNNFFTQFFGEASPEIQKAYKFMDESHRVFTIQDLSIASSHGTTLYWKHPLLDTPNPFYRSRAGRLKKRMRAVLKNLEKFRNAAKRNAAHLDFVRLGAERTIWMAEKIILTNDLDIFLKKSERDENTARRIAEKIDNLQKELRAQRDTFSTLWKSATRPEGLELNLLKFRYMDKWLEDIKTMLAENDPPDSLFLENPSLAPPRDKYEPGTECTFRRVFELDAQPDGALLQLAADGYAEAFVNGERVGDVLGRFSLSATHNLNKTKLWDVRNLLQPGANIVTVKSTNYEGSKSAINALLRMHDEDEAVSEISSDASWEAACVPKHGWDADTINEELWYPVKELDSPPTRWGKLLKPDFETVLPSYPGL